MKNLIKNEWFNLSMVVATAIGGFIAPGASWAIVMIYLALFAFEKMEN